MQVPCGGQVARQATIMAGRGDSTVIGSPIRRGTRVAVQVPLVLVEQLSDGSGVLFLGMMCVQVYTNNVAWKMDYSYAVYSGSL